MKSDDKKIYLLKVECSAVEVNPQRKKKTVRKFEKKYIFRNLESLDEKIKNLNGSKQVYDKPINGNWFLKLTTYVRRYGSNCKEAYNSVLRT